METQETTRNVYLRHRANGARAERALHFARMCVARLPELQAAVTRADAAVAACQDQRRYAEPYATLKAAAERARQLYAANRAFTYPPGKDCGAGSWQTVERNSSERLFYVHKLSDGLIRNIEDAGPLSGLRDGGEWYTDSFQDGTVKALVGQLRARNGRAVYVAGYVNSGDDGGATFDMGTLYIQGECGNEGEPKDDAACAACHMAERYAEESREYDSAWQAGAEYERQGDEIAKARKAALAVLAERRAFKGQAGFPALCAAIRGTVERHLEAIYDARRRRAALLEGDCEDYWWNACREELRDAFADAAGLSEFPQ